jgi:hypothetical protein
MRGKSHLIICRYGSPLFRRVSCSGFMLKILCSKRWSAPIEVTAFIHGAGAVRLNHPRRDLVRTIGVSIVAAIVAGVWLLWRI